MLTIINFEKYLKIWDKRSKIKNIVRSNNKTYNINPYIFVLHNSEYVIILM